MLNATKQSSMLNPMITRPSMTLPRLSVAWRRPSTSSVLGNRLLVRGAGAVSQHQDPGSGAAGESDSPAGKDRREMAPVRRVGEQVLQQIFGRQTYVAQTFGGEAAGQCCFRLPPAERALSTRAGHRDGRKSIRRARREYADHG